MVSNDGKVCSRCVMDSTDPLIRFYPAGTCNHCNNALEILHTPPFSWDKEKKEKYLLEKIQKIKEQGKRKKYDVVIGLSGGADSTWVACKVKDLGLRPLAVHLDNGWNTELAVNNIEKICKTLDIDLVTYVLDWDSFRDLQLAFLKASTPDAEIPTDHAIFAALYAYAARYGIRTIIIACNFYTESINSPAWSTGHYDWKYVKSVHRRYGERKLINFPHLSYPRWFYYKFIKRVRYFKIVDFLEYDRERVMDYISERLGWRPYGEKHYESFYTRFFQGYILPRKFGFDKRKAHYSSLICSGQVTREEALEKLEQPPLDPETEENDIRYAIKKLGISRDEFERIMSLPPKSFTDFPSYSSSVMGNLIDLTDRIEKYVERRRLRRFLPNRR